MRIASFVGQKGGVGKSTLARVLAVAAARAQHKVLIGDFDLEQLTCVEWGALRMRNGIEPEIQESEEIAQGRGGLRSGRGGHPGIGR
jgi:chromosome partitioning protein